jgi:hydrogenase-4 component F
MALALVLVPLAAGLLALLPVLQRLPLVRRALLLATAVAHAALTLAVWAGWPDQRPAPALNGWLALDAAGLLFLSITSVLFLAAAVYAVGYLGREAAPAPHADWAEGTLFVNEPEAVFVGCLLLFLAAMTGVTLSQHFTLLWVCVEATTLASAPLIYFHRHHRSLEAAWKYLLICSVGIALALPGNFALAAAGAHGPDPEEAVPLLLAPLKAEAGKLDPSWLRAAFLFLLVGYGTKMGLAPLHTWLPDAHSEAPSLVSALLSGALLNCAFLAVLRVHEVCVAGGQGAFSGELLVGFGLLSMAVAAVFILGQADYKRLLAYSSVEHMGVLALGAGLGAQGQDGAQAAQPGLGAYGMALHAVNHSLTKGALFLASGTILAVYRTRLGRDVRGLWRALPLSGWLWLLGFLSIAGAPPFGTFLSELTILRAALAQGRAAVAAGLLALLALIFLGMSAVVLPMVQGLPPKTAAPAEGPGAAAGTSWAWLTAPPVVLLSLVLLLGAYVPAAVQGVLTEVAGSLGGQAP